MGMTYDKYDKCFLIREDKKHKIIDGLSELIIIGCTKESIFSNVVDIHQDDDEAVVAVIVLLLQLPMQSVPITTDVVSSNLDQGEVYNIM